MNAYPKDRIQALGDGGFFSVAMTLLALDVRFPDDFQPKSSAEFLAGAAALWPKFFPYALSFWVLGKRWLTLLQYRSGDRDYPIGYGRWWLLYLFFVTWCRSPPSRSADTSTSLRRSGSTPATWR